MKIRNGFVSNSSSSSFILAVKGDLTVEKLLERFKVAEDSPIYPLAKDIAKCLVRSAEKTTIKEYMDNYGYDDLPEVIREIVKKDMTLYTGHVSDEEGGLEAAVCDMDFDFNDSEIIFKKEGGY